MDNQVTPKKEGVQPIGAFFDEVSEENRRLSERNDKCPVEQKRRQDAIDRDRDKGIRMGWLKANGDFVESEEE